MSPETVKVLELILYAVMAAGMVLACAGLWVSFNQDKLSD